MKSEAEIRQHRDDLWLIYRAPCNCTGYHASECEKGKLMIRDAVDQLDWILEKCGPERVEVVRMMHLAAEKIRQGPPLG